MVVNIVREVIATTQAEFRKRREFRCIHRHNGISHSKCYESGNKLKERVGYLDIESSNLNASFGVILSYCIGTDDGKVYKRVVTPDEIKKGTFDKDLLRDLVRDILRFDRVVTWYGSKFDIPYIRTRCLYHNVPFPVFRECMHTDAYMIAKYKLKMHSNRLGAVAPFLGIPAKGHPLNPEVWLKALSGNVKALKFILTHNIEDIVSLREVWKKINKYANLQTTSI